MVINDIVSWPGIFPGSTGLVRFSVLLDSVCGNKLGFRYHALLFLNSSIGLERFLFYKVFILINVLKKNSLITVCQNYDLVIQIYKDNKYV